METKEGIIIKTTVRIETTERIQRIFIRITAFSERKTKIKSKITITEPERSVNNS